MNKIILTIMALALCCATAGAQNAKADRLKEIRAAYADAKKRIEQNGKDGQSPKDMTIAISRLEDEEVGLYDMESIDYYFSETIADDKVMKHPYFIIENWSNHGHTRYCETLIDEASQQVMFCFMHGETDAGYVVESRYYYDEQGQCIEQKHNTTNSWTTEDSEKQRAEHWLQVFRLVNFDGYFSPIADGSLRESAMTKAERMKQIRACYAQAKADIDRNEKKEYPDVLHITLHDRGENWPPMTTDTQFFFDNGGCYFISSHDTSMASVGYCEYLFDRKSHDLMFSYTREMVEDTVYEGRYYFDEHGNCIETKSTSEETDDGFYDRRAARDLQAIFRLLVSEE